LPQCSFLSYCKDFLESLRKSDHTHIAPNIPGA
jgi:hypothetical protein